MYFGKKNRGLSEISELLQGFSDVPRKVNESKGSSINSRNRYIGGSTGFFEQEVKLFIPSSIGFTQLYRFTTQLDEGLLHRGIAENLVSMVPSRSKGTIFKLAFRPNKLSVLMDKLHNMPDVEKVEEKPIEEPGAFNSLKQFIVSLVPLVSSSEENDTAHSDKSRVEQESAVALNKHKVLGR